MAKEGVPMTIKESREARDTALDAVLNHNAIWRHKVLGFIETDLPQGWVGTGEDIRYLCTQDGIGSPGHPNAWGAVIMYAIRRKKWLQWTGRVRPMRQRSSHARITREYVRFDPLD